MTCTSDTVETRCRTLGEGLLKLCAHQSPYTGRTHTLFPSPQAASVHPRFEPTATPPSRATSRGCYRYANPPHRMCVRTYLYLRPRPTATLPMREILIPHISLNVLRPGSFLTRDHNIIS